MIRFIDLRGQGTGHRFAFWDTRRDLFCKSYDEQAWDAVAEFIEAYEYDIEDYYGDDPEHRLTRFTNLMPDWTDTPATEDELFFRDEAQSHEIP